MSNEKTMNESSKLYELGFHIVGTIDSNKVASVIDEIKSLITTHHGDIVREGEVREITLAYTMVKHIAGVNKKYNQTFFDWIKFTMNTDDVANLKSAVDSNERILRFILVKTVNDDEHSTSKMVEIEDVEEEVSEKEVVEEVKEEVSEKEVVEEKIVEKDTDQKIDEAIDEMVK
jgi:ribosomal protein S6